MLQPWCVWPRSFLRRAREIGSKATLLAVKTARLKSKFCFPPAAAVAQGRALLFQYQNITRVLINYETFLTLYCQHPGRSSSSPPQRIQADGPSGYIQQHLSAYCMLQGNRTQRNIVNHRGEIKFHSKIHINHFIEGLDTRPCKAYSNSFVSGHRLNSSYSSAAARDVNRFSTNSKCSSSHLRKMHWSLDVPIPVIIFVM
jgi:hypothetical protein